MAEIELAILFGKLNSLAYRSVESAATFSTLRGNPYVELAPWIHQILQLQDSDVHRIIQAFGMNPSRLAGDLTATLDRLPRGATTLTGISDTLSQAVKEGWMWASLLFGEGKVRTGHVVVGVLKTQSLRPLLAGMSGVFAMVMVEMLTDEFYKYIAGSSYDDLTVRVTLSG